MTETTIPHSVGLAAASGVPHTETLLHEDGPSPVFFDAILTPHRSLSRTGFALVMGALAGVTLAVGTAFLLMGAWPVIGFAGLELLAVYLMIRHSYRTGDASEHLMLTEDRLTLTRTDHQGRQACASLPTAWLQIRLNRPVRNDTLLLLSSHGVTVSVGGFLAPFEREQLATALTDALAEAKRPPHLRHWQKPVTLESQEPGGAA